ncbi:trehalose 6-phosphate synthase [Formivibrio citricus]|uniref:Trehalose 6-phosphate synthase n=1 Tax=Formivibrio citricus TaxID=83765 RepID=A0A1I4YXH4_9NEIS|nr:trehalose-6-phosphate synthase [Formivibrio citricus]SFN42724.1 trehalose 6-phosphate synthase [Formivibrio citricus]
MNTLRLQFRFLVPLFIVIAISAYLTVPLVDQLSLRWTVRDLNIRSQLIANTINDAIFDAVTQQSQERLAGIFNRLIKDERVLGIAICDQEGRLFEKSSGFPDGINCSIANKTAKNAEPTMQLARGSVHIAIEPLKREDTIIGELILVHDLSYAERRGADTRQYLILLFIVLGGVIALITVITAHLSLRGWVAGTRMLLQGKGLLNPFDLPAPELQPLVQDLRTLLRELEDERRSRESPLDAWTPEKLRALLHNDLQGDEVLVVSNREPYIHEKTPNGIVVKRPASGLVTAVEPVMRACSGTWVAHGSGSADRDVVDANDVVMVPPDHPTYSLKRVWLTREEEEGYYYGFANEGLWPLCHIAHVRPVFRVSDWEYYKEVNRRFADKVIASARTDDPVILVQDYHFALLPQLIREKLPRATIITFWHIPWPNPESFGICPWRAELLRGMLGSSILGFHTRFHCKNFIDTVDRYLETRIEHEHSTITLDGRETLIKNYPISIHWPDEQEESAWPETEECRRMLRRNFNLSDSHLVAIGVDRFDYTKGILERANAVERMLEKHPDMIGKFSLIQIAAPSRSSLDEYRYFQERLSRRVEEINRRFGRDNYQPFILLAEHQGSEILTRYYRGADACIVTSLHDGMNLVSKEFIACRNDMQGVLILSQFAGAAGELPEALIVNPYHVEETADALYQALTMPEAEQRERIRSLRATVRERNVYRWAGFMLQDAAHARRRERIEARLLSHKRQS